MAKKAILQVVSVMVMMLVTGCDCSFKYTYDGTLLHGDGTPASGERIAVCLVSSGGDFFPDMNHFPQCSTDVKGHFAGEFRGNFGACAGDPAPELDAVWAYIAKSGGWHLLTVPVSHEEESESSPRHRILHLRPIHVEAFIRQP